MIIEDEITFAESLLPGSHKSVTIICDFQISDRCRNTYLKPYRDILEHRSNNKGKDICLYCSRKLKFTGGGNPNTKYKIDGNYFNKIDTTIKAYCLGLIAADGHVRKSGFVISLQKRDVGILEDLKDIFDSLLPITPIKDDAMRSLTINSQAIASDIARWLSIEPSTKKSGCVQFPDLGSEKLHIAFLRGYFDGDGSIRNPRLHNAKGFPYPECSITSNSFKMLRRIKDIVQTGSLSETQIIWTGNSCLDFLGKIYADLTYPYLERKFSLYNEWSIYVPGVAGGIYNAKMFDQFKVVRTSVDAVLPYKKRASDTGYDLTLIKELKRSGQVVFYDTGLKIQPCFGWMTLIMPRSSLPEAGYMISNLIGVIDRSYIGNIIIQLTKIDDSKPDLVLPFRAVQLVPMPIVNVNFKEVTELDESDRGFKGFGSTG